jgi:hypothetical protein
MRDALRWGVAGVLVAMGFVTFAMWVAERVMRGMP